VLFDDIRLYRPAP